MKLLYLGDVVGKAGRNVVYAELPGLRKRLSPDCVIVNVENAAHGFGVTAKICADMLEAGVDVMTTGNHTWDQREMLTQIDSQDRLLRPANFPDGTPGRGSLVFSTRNGRKVAVIQVMGRVFMDPLECPFTATDRFLNRHALKTGTPGTPGTIDAVVVDIHGEATSEKMALGHVCDGRASLVVGSHSHIPTADAQILPGGTAYQTDAGMCGDYDSVIGMKKDVPIRRFRTKLPQGRFEPAEGPATLCGVFCEADDRTGLARRIEPVRIGGRLKGSWPVV